MKLSEKTVEYVVGLIGTSVRITSGTMAGTVGTVKKVTGGAICHIKPTQTTRHSVGVSVLYVPAEYVEVISS